MTQNNELLLEAIDHAEQVIKCGTRDYGDVKRALVALTYASRLTLAPDSGVIPQQGKNLNAPDLESLKEEMWHKFFAHCSKPAMSSIIDHLAPRIVRDGMVRSICRGGDVIDKRLITLEVPEDFKIKIGAYYFISAKNNGD